MMKWEDLSEEARSILKGLKNSYTNQYETLILTKSTNPSQLYINKCVRLSDTIFKEIKDYVEQSTNLVQQSNIDNLLLVKLSEHYKLKHNAKDYSHRSSATSDLLGYVRGKAGTIVTFNLHSDYEIFQGVVYKLTPALFDELKLFAELYDDIVNISQHSNKLMVYAIPQGISLEEPLVASGGSV